MTTIQPTWNQYGFSFVDVEANIGVKDRGLGLLVEAGAAVVRYGPATKRFIRLRVTTP